MIKQVVDYSSKSVISNIEKHDYRKDEVMQILGNRFLSPKDDEELIKRKISRIKTNKNYYKTESFGNAK